MALYIIDYQIYSVKYCYWEKSNTGKKFTRHLFKYYSTPFFDTPSPKPHNRCLTRIINYIGGPFCFVYEGYAHMKNGHLFAEW